MCFRKWKRALNRAEGVAKEWEFWDNDVESRGGYHPENGPRNDGEEERGLFSCLTRYFLKCHAGQRGFLWSVCGCECTACFVQKLGYNAVECLFSSARLAVSESHSEREGPGEAAQPLLFSTG